MFINKKEMEVLEQNGTVFILAYDFNKNHSGIKRVVQSVENRLKTSSISDLIHGMVIVPDGGKREKTRYVLVGIPEDYLYLKDGVKHLDFIHKSMGYKDEHYKELKVGRTVEEILKKLNLILAKNKYSGVQVVESWQLWEGHLYLEEV